jgi:GNAT superfamily N-acetyltransferase
MPTDLGTGSLALVQFQPAHVAAAASLVAGRVRELRAGPGLPEAWTDAAAVAGSSAACRARLRGRSVPRGAPGRVQAAMLLDGRGGRWAWTPDVGHAVDDASGERVLEALYARLAGPGCATAVPSTSSRCSPTTTRARPAWRLGSAAVADLVRDLAPVRLDGARVPSVRAPARRTRPRSSPSTRACGASRPRRLPGHGPARSAEVQRRILDDPGTATFLAEDDEDDEGAEGAVAFLRIGPPSEDVALIVRDAGTASITAAFTLEARRGEGVATALLAAAVDWARAAGHARCAVDHETANREAARFWSRQFTTVAVSMARRLPPRDVVDPAAPCYPRWRWSSWA